MAAATVTTQIQTALPSVEVVVLTATDAETYTSRKFGAIAAVSVADNEDTGTPIAATFATNVVTIQWTGVTDGKCTVTIWGHRR